MKVFRLTIETSHSKVAKWFSMGFDNPFMLYEIASLNSYDKKELGNKIFLELTDEIVNLIMWIWKFGKVSNKSFINLITVVIPYA